MAYTKKVWVSGEKINASDLNNIEDEIDGISDLTHTFAGQKFFSGKLTVQNELHVTASYPKIYMNDQAPGGKQLYIYNLGGEIHIYEPGVGYHIRDIAGHGHEGGTDGVQLNHTYLTGVTGDQHHDEDHAATHAFGGTDGLTGGVPVDVGGANAEGSGTAFARNDHVHNHPVYTSGDKHQDYLLEDGSRDLTGDMDVDEDITIDGVDVSDYNHRQYSLLHDEFEGIALNTFLWKDDSTGTATLSLSSNQLVMESDGSGNVACITQNNIRPIHTDDSFVEVTDLETFITGLTEAPVVFKFRLHSDSLDQYISAEVDSATHGNSNIWLVCKDNVSTSKQDTGVALSTPERIRIELTPGTPIVKLYIDDVLEASVTTNIPSVVMDIETMYESTNTDKILALAYIRCVTKYDTESLKR